VYYWDEAQAIATTAIVFGFVQGIIADAVIAALDYLNLIKTGDVQRVCATAGISAGGAVTGLGFGLTAAQMAEISAAAAGNRKAAAVGTLGAALGLAFVGLAVDIGSTLLCR